MCAVIKEVSVKVVIGASRVNTTCTKHQNHRDAVLKAYTIFDLITTHTPISAQSRNSVVFRLQPVYFFFTSL